MYLVQFYDGDWHRQIFRSRDRANLCFESLTKCCVHVEMFELCRVYDEFENTIAKMTGKRDADNVNGIRINVEVTDE